MDKEAFCIMSNGFSLDVDKKTSSDQNVCIAHLIYGLQTKKTWHVYWKLGSTRLASFFALKFNTEQKA